ncbi:hypothetical protein AYJ08_00675 [Brevibacillus sp. SKDU10]|uniref:hypothetical protein n=1 Tax=Brevibacillus sp. SKDU10 TaxID=1247872 RepID=UPI0007C94F64|nr:hypothetical protein AYJ08_00675 [Brevibacillus sp. SKDU10]
MRKISPIKLQVFTAIQTISDEMSYPPTVGNMESQKLSGAGLLILILLINGLSLKMMKDFWWIPVENVVRVE